MRAFPRVALLLLALCAVGAPGPATAQVGRVLRLPEEPGPHWIWVGDLFFRRTALVDAGSGRFLGMLSTGLGTITPHFSPDGREIYLPETHYARGTRGERTDVVTIYDAVTLAPVAEVGIPPTRAEHVSGAGCSALSDDGRFLAIFNMTPGTSLSIVDVRERSFAGEIAAPGCSLVYAAGARRFAMLCGDGALLSVTLDDAGAEVGKRRSEPFFDPESDPVTEKAVRHGDRWLFVSFEGYVHPVDVGAEPPRFGERWSLLSDADRAGSWRIGGAQHLAVHQRSARLYSLVHQGGPDTHKEPGTEVWVYDLARRERVGRIEVRNPVGTFLRQAFELSPEGLVGGLADWVLQGLLPNPGVDRIQVTQDEQPLLVTASGFPATLSVHDATSGEHLRDLDEIGIALAGLETP